MFIQVIRGKATDVEALLRQFEKWESEVRPGAQGFLGSTGGITPDGQLIELARFESEDAARRNSDRPEQAEWWEETSRHIADVSFVDTTDVDLQLGGGDDSAGFVQVMQGRATDRAKLEELEGGVLDRLREARPEILGMVRAWHPDGASFTQAVYFRSEAEARDGEKSEPPTDVAGDLEAWDSLLTDMQYFDLRDPFLL